MKETFYFSHDHNSRTDTKIRKLLAKHGMMGYGIFWAVVEDLYNNANALQLDFDSIAYDLRVDSEIIKSVLSDFGLFNIENEVISSKSVQERIDKRDAKSLKASESARARWNKTEEPDANALQPESEPDAIKEIIIKESKGDDTEKEKVLNIPFSVFWDAYGLKEEKTPCSKKWSALTNKEREIVMSDLPIYFKSLSDLKYKKYPFKYLNNKMWEARQESNQSPSISPEIKQEREVRYTNMMQRTQGMEYNREHPMKFHEKISVYHLEFGMYDQLK